MVYDLEVERDEVNLGHWLLCTEDCWQTVGVRAYHALLVLLISTPDIALFLISCPLSLIVRKC